MHVYRGERERATILLRRALPLARWSLVGRCVLPRIYGTMIGAASDAESARAVVDWAEATLGPHEQCPFCAIMLAVPAAQACAATGELDRARRYLTTAETVEARWDGTAWAAALLEVRAAMARAEGQDGPAGQLLTAAAELFDGFGQPLDAARCRALARSISVPAPRRPRSGISATR